MLARFNSVRVGHGESYLLITVLACFLGGVNPFGGFGRVIPVFVALVVLQLLSSGLNLMGANQHLATAVWGILLIAVMILRLARRPAQISQSQKRMKAMEGFGVHTSMWTMNWDRAGAEKAIAAAVKYEMDFIEIALLNAPAVDAAHTRDASGETQAARRSARSGCPNTPGPPCVRMRRSSI